MHLWFVHPWVTRTHFHFAYLEKLTENVYSIVSSCWNCTFIDIFFSRFNYLTSFLHTITNSLFFFSKILAGFPRGSCEVTPLSNLSIQLLLEQLNWVKVGGLVRPFPYRLPPSSPQVLCTALTCVLCNWNSRIKEISKSRTRCSQTLGFPVLLRASGCTCLEMLSSIFSSRRFSIYDSLGCGKDSQAYSFSGNFPYGANTSSHVCVHFGLLFLFLILSQSLFQNNVQKLLHPFVPSHLHFKR